MKTAWWNNLPHLGDAIEAPIHAEIYLPIRNKIQDEIASAQQPPNHGEEADFQMVRSHFKLQDNASGGNKRNKKKKTEDKITEVWEFTECSVDKGMCEWYTVLCFATVEIKGRTKMRWDEMSNH